LYRHDETAWPRPEPLIGDAAQLFCSWSTRASPCRFAEKYSPDVSVFTDGKVEILFKLTYSQAENLARLMKGHDL
jgi:hypothetical protein